MQTGVYSFILCAIVVAGISVGCNRGARPGPNPKVTQANFERIEIGMSMDEVKAILGESWKIEQSDGPDDFIMLNDVQVWAIHEWRPGGEADTPLIRLGFRDGTVVAISQTGFER